MNIFSQIVSTLFGTKYYLPIYVLKGTFKTVTSATPYRSKKEALQCSLGLEAYQLIEVISFRSRENYQNGELQ